jgi:hypothetical protein
MAISKKPMEINSQAVVLLVIRTSRKARNAAMSWIMMAVRSRKYAGIRATRLRPDRRT